MTQKSLHILILTLVVILGGCTSESEKILTERIENEDFNFSDFKMTSNGISYNTKDYIQYGFIHLDNGEDVKFWFLTHHSTSDIGGTFYEFPNGEKEFYSGLHCCEVQFYENGELGKTFQDEAELKSFVTERDGKRP